jgi:hypothetical protein
MKIEVTNTNRSQSLTGLFLGAGASAELGMPLVWELTEGLKQWLTPDKLRRFNEGWHLQGGGKSDAVIEDFLSVWAVIVHSAGIQDRVAARAVLMRLFCRFDSITTSSPTAATQAS